MSNIKLNYYVRIDASGRPVLGGIVLRKNMPKIGKWKIVPTEECCKKNLNKNN